VEREGEPREGCDAQQCGGIQEWVEEDAAQPSWRNKGQPAPQKAGRVEGDCMESTETAL
jgi:hypothetical protein